MPSSTSLRTVLLLMLLTESILLEIRTATRVLKEASKSKDSLMLTQETVTNLLKPLNNNLSLLLLMPQIGNSTLVVFSTTAERDLTMVSSLLVNRMVTGRSETHGVPAGENKVTSTFKVETHAVSAKLPHTPTSDEF